MELRFKKLKKLWKNGIIFRGFCPEKEKLLLYDIADIVVVPSVYEPFSIVTLEALARGKKVVTSSRVGCRDMVKKCNGIIIPYSDDFSKKLFKVLSNFLEMRQKKFYP